VARLIVDAIAECCELQPSHASRSRGVALLLHLSEWAESPDEVYINIKFAHKLDTPATLGVTIDAVDITADRLVLKGSSPGRKQFLLDLSLYGTVDPDNSSWSSGSVGRMTIQLKKQQTVMMSI
jgi:CS domain